MPAKLLATLPQDVLTSAGIAIIKACIGVAPTIQAPELGLGYTSLEA